MSTPDHGMLVSQLRTHPGPTMKRPKDIASRHAERRDSKKLGDGLIRETFVLPIEDARIRARLYLDRYPAAVYMSRVESWRELSDGRIEFTMRRLPTAD
jgi:hypothetical protein